MLRNLDHVEETSQKKEKNNQIESVSFHNNQLFLESRESKIVINVGSSNLICVSVDGSDHSDLAFDLVTKEFLGSDSKILLMYICNSKYDDTFNYRNKKQTIVSRYGSKMIFFSERSFFLIEDRNYNCSHSLEQVHSHAAQYKANFFFTGYYGIKGPKGDNKELTKGTDYLLSYCTIPLVIVKDTKLRQYTKTGGYNWLFVFDKKFSTPLKCFHAFAPLVDPSKDFVMGLTLKEVYSVDPDDIQSDFMTAAESMGIKNISYEFANYEKAASSLITSKVNFGEIIFDFVVIFNNTNMYRQEKGIHDTANIVKNCSSSLCVYQI
jgi:hypothetical protein